MNSLSSLTVDHGGMSHHFLFPRRNQCVIRLMPLLLRNHQQQRRQHRYPAILTKQFPGTFGIFLSHLLTFLISPTRWETKDSWLWYRKAPLRRLLADPAMSRHLVGFCRVRPCHGKRNWSCRNCFWGSRTRLRALDSPPKSGITIVTQRSSDVPHPVLGFPRERRMHPRHPRSLRQHSCTRIAKSTMTPVSLFQLSAGSPLRSSLALHSLELSLVCLVENRLGWACV